MSGTGFNTSFGTGSTSGVQRKQPLEYKKIFCAYHSTEFLTNFCIDKECLMPLCPTCVVEHTEEHYQRGQKPSYVNLHDALHESRQNCYSWIVRLEEFDRRNMELSSYINGLPQYIRKQLSDCKQHLYQIIEQRFQEYENKMIEEIRAKYAEEGVYSRKECEEVREFISSQIEILYEKITNLKGDQCLASLIRYYENDEKSLEEQIEQVSSYIQRNRKAGGLYLSLHKDQAMQQLEQLCEKVIRLEYVQQDEGRSYSSSKHFEGSSVKKGISSSVVKRVGGSGVKGSGIKGSGIKGSGVKERLGQSFSSQKPLGGNFHSPFHGTDQF